MGKLVKSIPMEVKLNEESRTFEGYASTFGNMDYVGDIVVPGAFKKSIMERFPKKQIKVLYQHSEPLGIPLHMEEDSKGLYVKAHISRTTLGNDVLELMRDGVIDRMSIGYNIVQEEKDSQNNVRLLKELKLFEFSPVTFPANDEAIISQVKSVQDLEQYLDRAVGGGVTRLLKEGRVLSKSTATKISIAIEALNEVLSAANVEEKGADHEPSKDTHGAPSKEKKDDTFKVDPTELQSILNNLKTTNLLIGVKDK